MVGRSAFTRRMAEIEFRCGWGLQESNICLPACKSAIRQQRTQNGGSNRKITVMNRNRCVWQTLCEAPVKWIWSKLWNYHFECRVWRVFGQDSGRRVLTTITNDWVWAVQHLKSSNTFFEPIKAIATWARVIRAQIEADKCGDKERMHKAKSIEGTAARNCHVRATLAP